MKPWVSIYQPRDLNGGWVHCWEIHQGRLAGGLPTYIKTNISLGTGVEVQQVTLSFAISETFLPAHKPGSVTGEDLWEYEFKEIDRNANYIHLILHVDSHISHALDWTCPNLPLSSSGKPDFNQEKDAECGIWNQAVWWVIWILYGLLLSTQIHCRKRSYDDLSKCKSEHGIS